MLAEIRGKLDHNHPRVALLNAPQRGQRLVGAAIVDVNELDTTRERRRCRSETAVQLLDHLAAGVVERHDHRHSHIACLHAANIIPPLVHTPGSRVQGFKGSSDADQGRDWKTIHTVSLA